MSPVIPSENSISLCNHQDDKVIEEMPKYQFICDRCGKGFTHKNNLLRHKKEHDAPTNSQNQPKPHASNQFRENTQKDDKVYKHKKFQFQFNFSDIQNCDQCGKVFQSKSELEEHEVEHIAPQEKENIAIQPARVVCVCAFPCVPLVTHSPKTIPTVTGKVAPAATSRMLDNTLQATKVQPPIVSLPQHMDLQEENQEGATNQKAESQALTQGWRRQGSRFSCNTCSYTRNTPNQIESHIRDRHGEEEEDGNYCCRYCSFQINTSDKLIEHIERAHGSELDCKMCDYKSGQKKLLDKHIEENHKSSNHCLVCDLYFRNIEELSKHMDLIHDNNEEPLVKCNHCGKGQG